MCSLKWESVEIKTNEGKKQAVAPLIISASRSTDIPAFYSDWFFNRLKKGYIKWINPFNQKPQYVSLKNTRLIVFWSKNPRPIIDKLHILDNMNINYYFQFTVNDYEEEGFERNLAQLNERIETFKELSQKIGKEKVIWRFDPLILTDKVNVEKLLEKVRSVGNELYKFTNKLVLSFADIGVYTRVKRNLLKYGINYIEFDEEKMIKLAKGIYMENKKWDLEISTCSENIDLAEYNINHNKCIDDDLIIKLFSDDSKLMDFIGFSGGQQTTFDELLGTNNKNLNKTNKLKDKGQRKECGCILSKDIGQYNTCNHQCIYCYANYSIETAKNNYMKYKKLMK